VFAESHVPASRSRTERWRESLRQIEKRGGGLEIALAPVANLHASDLIWRVRILALSDAEITVERPTALGHAMDLPDGTAVVAAMSVGQNRWMFHTRVLGLTRTPRGAGMRLVMPDGVERCQRRCFYRVSTVRLSLPQVECWPLLDPASVEPAERANRARIAELSQAGAVATETEPAPVLPRVGAMFGGTLLNIGGGGAGLLVGHADAGAVERARMLWLRVDLRPHVPGPLAVSARLVHSHLDSEQNVYAGLAFDFTFDSAHKDFVVAQICRYVAAAQRQGAPRAA
jgi:hypothetical protein